MSAARLLSCLPALCLLLYVPAVAAQNAVFYDGFEPVPLKINEIEADDELGGLDWVEFRNPTTSPVDLTGWYFTDNDPTHVETFAPGTVVPAGGFLVIEPASFGLGSFGDDVALFTPRQQLADFYSWNAPAPAASTYGRCPDGTGAFGVRSPPTRGSANCP